MRGNFPRSRTMPDKILGSLQVSDEDIRRASELLRLPRSAFFGTDGNDPRQEVLRSMETIDIAACPGSGKTTLLVAKLAILAEAWPFRTRGICVLSHTNVARAEVETVLGNTNVGRRLLSYPHYIGTIHGFVNDFLALPWLRSRGYAIKMIDTDACRHRRWNALSATTRKALMRNNHGPAVLTVHTPTFGVGEIKWGKGVLGTSTPTYREIQRACEKSVGDGYFCYDELFVWARHLMDCAPGVIPIIRDRFPLLFMDEAQDNSEQQSAILQRVFCSGSDPVVRQRFGDGNQAIFSHFDAVDAITDKFPGGEVLSLPNSHRFGQDIADLADPLALTPHNLQGQGPKKTLDSGSVKARHTLFLFDVKDMTKVLDAYGQLLIETFSIGELREGTFTAIGQVHRPPEAESAAKRPSYVGHYWPDYAPELSGRDPKPGRFVLCISSGAAVARARGESYLAVERIAEGILRLADLIDDKNNYSRSGRRHARAVDVLRNDAQAHKAYADLIDTFAIKREVLNEQAWNAHWRDNVLAIGKAIAGRTLSTPEADTFLEWSEAVGPASAPMRGTQANSYKYPPSVPT